MSWKVVFLVGVALSVAGVAIAGSSGSKSVTLCAAKRGGDLTLGGKGKCSKGEKKVTIARQGPQGEQGPQGPPGKDGTPADLAPEAVHLVTAPAGPTSSSCASTPGRFCGFGPTTSCSYDNPGAPNLPTGFRKDSGGWVHLQGAAYINFSGAGCTAPPGIFYLPPGYRPQADARFSAPDCFSDTATTNVEVAADGLVKAAFTGSNCVNLDGIEFHP